MKEKSTNKKRHPCVFYTLHFLCQTRLTLYAEQNDQTNLLVAVSIVGLSFSQREAFLHILEAISGSVRLEAEWWPTVVSG